jgi:hypothetical protein
MTRWPRLFCAVVVLSAISGWANATTFTVDSSGRTGYATIQSAVDRAVAGDVIILNAGTYTGAGNTDVNFRGKAITIQSTTPQDANVAAATIVNCQATAASPRRAFYLSGCTGAKIVGLTITNGLAASGGAIYCTNSALDISYCRILDNSTLAGDGKVTLSGGSGGGIYAEVSSLRITNCLISGNTTSVGAKSQTGTSGDGGDGAGIYATGSYVLIEGSTVSNNRTGNGADSSTTSGRGGDGGGVYCDSLAVKGSSIFNNATGHGGVGGQGGRGGDGGAIVCRRGEVYQCSIEGNIAGSGGNTTASGKAQAARGGNGGGIVASDSLKISDCLVAGNGSGRAGLIGAVVSPSSDGAGAGIWCASGQIDRCTIVSNSALQSNAAVNSILGAGLYCTSQTTVTNSILWGNTPDQIAGQDCSKVSYCDIQAGACATGKGNLAADPLFVSPGKWEATGEVIIQDGWTDRSTSWTSGNFRLSSSSPCIDKGDAGFTADANAVDLGGQSRVADGRVDMGAYEFQSLVAIYHFESPVTSKHFYTASAGERDKLIQKSSSAWTYKGVAYYAYVRAADARLKPVYRFWSDKLGSHFWTISESEKAKLVGGTAWTYEGISFYAFAADDRPADTKPVYRFWSATIGGHYYTIDETEKDQLISAKSGLWTYEAPAWYAYDKPPTTNEEKPATEATSYSFTAGADGVVYQMTLKAVVDGQEARLDDSTILFTPALGHMLMNVDLDGLTVTMTSLFIESEFLQHSATASQSVGGTTASYAFTLSAYGFFNTATLHGPYAIDGKAFTLSLNQASAAVGLDEDFTIVGSVSLDGKKYDVNVTLPASTLNLQGVAVLDKSDYPSNLAMTMNGPFQWRRQGQEDLLLDVTVKGHRVQLYAASLTVQTTGLWSGKLASAETKNSK